jgi:pSer/pThr/pTyr-binding forkhead associated (FHA) protein
MGKLLHMQGDTVVHEIDLSKQVFTIGRALHCNLSIDDPHISQHHTQIIADRDEQGGKVSYRLKDLYSTNGTFVNNQRVDAIQLKDHDTVCIGSSIFTFCEKQAS